MITWIIPLTLFAVLGASPSSWLSKQTKVFGETMRAWFPQDSTDGMELTLNTVFSNDIQSERQANLVSNILIDLVDRVTTDGRTWYDVLNDLDSGLSELGVDIEPYLVDSKQRDYLRITRHARQVDQSPSRTVAQDLELYSARYEEVLQAVQLAIAEAKDSLKEGQYASVKASLNQLANQVDKDVFSGMIEGAYLLGRMGIRLLKSISIPGESESRMILIRRIVSYWLFGTTNTYIRHNMINLMRNSSDDELEQIALSWFVYVEAYNAFKTRATLAEAVAGFGPYQLMYGARSLADLQQIKEYCSNMMRTSELIHPILRKKLYKDLVGVVADMSRNPTDLLDYAARAGQLYFTHILPVVANGPQGEYILATMMEFPSAVNHLVLDTFDTPRCLDAEVRTALENAVDAALTKLSSWELNRAMVEWADLARLMDNVIGLLDGARDSFELADSYTRNLTEEEKSRILSECISLTTALL